MSSDEVNDLLILKKWRDSNSLIKLRLDTDSFSLWLWVDVTEVSETILALRVLGREGAAVTLDLRGAEFRYQDPREADESAKANFESAVICALSVLLADGTNFVLYEWRSDLPDK